MFFFFFFRQNVCASHKSKSVSTSIVLSTVNYQQYTTKCGFLNWGRCKRSRLVIYTIYTEIYTKARVYTKKIQVTSGISMVYHDKVLHNYYIFIPCHRKYAFLISSGIKSQRTVGRLNLIPLNKQRLSCILIGCIFYGMV